MSGQALRFLHASDFHLDQPFRGLAEIPTHLREALLDAPYLAAERVFDAALRERVDFLLLAGDLIDVGNAGPRGISFLLNQLERMHGQGVAVYWAGGQVDPPQDWPVAAKLPDGVLVFPCFQGEEHAHFRGDRAVANILGRSWSGASHVGGGELGFDAAGLFTILVAHGAADLPRLAERAVDYWALGGEHERRTLDSSRPIVHYPGTTQGRSPAELGPRGCTLVQVGEDRIVRSQFIPTDAVRFQAEELVLEPGENQGDLKLRLNDRMKRLQADAADRLLLITWTLRGGQRFGAPPQLRGLASDLLASLRTDFGQGRAAVWTLAVQFEEQAIIPPAWYEEESMLGDFLRKLRGQESADAALYDLLPYVPAKLQGTKLAAIADWTDAATRREVLQEAARLGAQLLGGDERV